MSPEDSPFDVKRLRMERRITTLHKLILREGEIGWRKVVEEFHFKIGVQPETVKKYLAILEARGLVRLQGGMVTALQETKSVGIETSRIP